MTMQCGSVIAGGAACIASAYMPAAHAPLKAVKQCIGQLACSQLQCISHPNATQCHVGHDGHESQQKDAYVVVM